MLARQLLTQASEHATSKPGGAAPERSGFLALDQLLAGGAEPAQSEASRAGLVIVTAPAEALDALADHIERCSLLAGREVIAANAGPASDGWRTVARGLASHAPLVTSREIAAAVVSAGDVGRPVVIVERDPSRFSAATAAEIASAPTSARRVFWLVSRTADPSLTHVSGALAIEIEAELDADGLAAWWSAAARDGGPTAHAAAPRLAEVEAWWRRARTTALVSEANTYRGKLLPLELAGRPWPVASLRLLGLSLEDAGELSSQGLVDVRDGHVVVRGCALSSHLTAPGRAAWAGSDARRVSDALTSLFPKDAWATMRAGELALGAGDFAHGDALVLDALREAVDAEARLDFWSRFVSATPTPTPNAERLLPFVELALRTGDIEYALRFAREASASEHGQRPEIMLALGRSLAASGDLGSATAAIEQVLVATQNSDNGSARGLAVRAAAELAEVRYFANDFAGARVVAEAALEGAGSALAGRDGAIVRLDARNVLGKLLLAQADYASAESHFADDACQAALHADLVSELRARANRAIAVMSMGRRGEAQAMLEEILHEAESAHELKAVGLSLINLAALAIFDRRYAEALSLSERAADVLRRIGDRLRLSRVVANLAELRVRLGLVDEAAQAVRFGARAFRGGPPPERASHFAVIMAHIALAKADSGAAHRHITEALAAVGAASALELSDAYEALDREAPRGPVRDRVIDALQLAAYAALEDGDIVRARRFLARAASEHAPQNLRAKLHLLRAMLARAEGEPTEELGHAALAAARDLDDDELLRETHTLLCQCALDRDDEPSARSHFAAAVAVRGRVADALPPALRKSFLGRRDVANLEALGIALDERARSNDEDARRSSFPPASPSRAGTAPTPGSLGQPAHPLLERQMVGRDPAVLALQKAIKKVGPSEATVLIHGESGTGKELVAEALHAASGRKDGPMVKVNCAALVETLLLSELFGHEKGAFTGAAGRRRGRFEAAEGGTLFLDEIGDISSRTQVALLRVLQEKTFERVGGTTPIRANVRVVCATHRNLKAAVAAGTFREDLYYRLCGINLEVPSLRARLGDLPAVADALLQRIAAERGGAVKQLSPRALTALKSHPWPGNIRELENALRAASLFADGDVLEAEDFADNVDSLRHISETVAHVPVVPESRPAPELACPSTKASGGYEVSMSGPEDALVVPVAPRSSGNQPRVPEGTPSEVAYAQVRSGVSLHDLKRLIERDCIAKALGESQGNITKAATLLGMKRPRLSQLVKQYGLGAGSDGVEFEDGDDAAEEE